MIGYSEFQKRRAKGESVDQIMRGSQTANSQQQYQQTMNRSGLPSYDQFRRARENGASAQDIFQRFASEQQSSTQTQPKRESSSPNISPAEQFRQDRRSKAEEKRTEARSAYADLVSVRDSVKSQADEMLVDYNQRIEAGESREDLADYYLKILDRLDRASAYDEQVKSAYDTLKTAEQEYKDVYADYNAARDEVKASRRNLRDVESQYSGWATDDLSAQNVEAAMNDAEDVKAARERLAKAREEYIKQGGNPDANIFSAGLKGSAAGVVDAFGYLQELALPENEKRWGIFTTGHMTDQQRHHQEVLEAREKARYEAEHGAGTYVSTPGYIRTQDTAARLARESAEETASMKAGRSQLGQFGIDMGVQGVQMGTDAVAGKVLPGGSLTAMALRTFGSGVREARENGANIYQQGLYGAGTAAVEVLTEKMFGLTHIYGANMTDSLVSHAIGKFTSNRLGQAALGMVADALGEGLEEVISDIANPILKTIYNDKTIRESFRDNWNWSDVLYDFAVGAAMGFVGGSVEGVTEATGLSAPDAQSEFFMKAGENGMSFGEAIRDWKSLQQVSGASVEAQTDAAFDVLTGKESLEQQQARQSDALQRWGLTEEEAKNYIDTGRVYNPLTVSARDRGTVTLGGEEVKIVSAKGEDVTVEQNGEQKTVKLDELEGMSEGYKKLVQAAAESEYGEAVLRLYNPGQDVDAYTKAWSYAEDVFGAQTNISLEKARENPLLKDLTDGQLKFALELGRQRYDASKATASQRAAQFKAARQEALKAGAFARKKGTVNTKGGTFVGRTVKGVDVKKLSTSQKKLFAMTQALADAVNINFVVYDGEANEGGSYIKGGTVMVNINSGQLSGKNLGAASLSHELTHYLQDFSPEEYGQLKDFITSEILKASPEKFAQLVQKQMDLEPNISPEAAGDEVIANACQTMLLNSEAINQLARQNMSLAERISDWISETAKKIKAAYKSVDLNDNVEIYEAARAISGVMDEAQKLWDKALLAADKNYNAEQATGKKNTADKGGVQNVKYGMTELTNKPDMHLTIVNDTAAQSRSDILDAGMKNAKRYGGVTKDGAVFVHVKDNGDDVHVTRDGLRHGLDRRKQVNAPVTMKVGEVLSNAIEINELNPRDLTRTQETKVLIGAAKNQNNEPYIALFVVNRTTGQLEDFDTLYSVNAKTSPQNKKKSAGSLSPGSGQIVPASLTDSDISIADLLQYVNKYFPDVLPEEVLKHFGHSSRPEGKLGASALFQKWGIGETAEEREARKESISNLKTENSILRARAKYWRDQTRQTRERTVRQQDTDRMANDLLREYESRTDKAEIKSDLKALGDYLVQAGELDYEELHDRAEDIADRIIDGNYTLIDDSNKENLDRLKGFLKGTALNLSASDFSDTGDEGFRKRYGRYFTVRENGRSIDSAWGELAGMFGEGLFPEDTYAPGDMLRMIGDYLDLWRPQYGNIFENARGEAVDAVTNEIIDRVLSEDVRQTPATYADKAQQKLNAQIAKDRARLDALREQKNARIEEIKREAAEKNMQIRLAEKAMKYEAVDKVKQHYRDMMQRQRGKRSDTALRGKIKKLHKELSDMLIRPMEKRYVPRELVKATAEILDAIDTTSGRAVKAKAALAELKVRYESLAKDDHYALAYDETVGGMIQELAENIGDGSIYDLTGSELEGVYNTLKALKHTIQTANKLVGAQIEADAFEAANQMMRETENAKGIPTKALRKFVMAQMTPASFFRMAGGYVKNSMWEQMFDMLNQGQLTQTQVLMEGGQIFRELIDDKKNLDTLHDQKNLVDIGLKDDLGNSIKITRGMMLSVYMHLQNEQNARHISYGGLTVPRLRQYYKNQMADAFNGKTGRAVAFATEIAELNQQLSEAETEQERTEIQDKIAELQEQTDAYMSDLRAQIEKQLTEYDRKWIAAAQKFFDEYSKNKLNEVTEMVYGFSKAQVDHYFPIHTDANYRAASFDTIVRDMSLENAGFMKERINGANPILLEDITDVISSQLRRTAQYVGLMPAIRNFNKAYGKARAGYSMSVQSAMARTFENEGKKYIENLMADLNGARKTEANIFDELRGNMAGAVLTLNPRVTLAQAASFPSAAAEIGYTPLMKALTDMKNPMWDKGLQDEIAKWTPLWWYRMQGYSTAELGDIKNNEQFMAKVMDKMKWATGWIQAADGLTTGGLWQASKYYVDENFSDLQKGSDEYMMKVAEVYNRVLEKTQPDYTTMQRPDILRNPNAIVKQLTMFMTQRLQNMNILYDAAATYSHYVRDMDKGRNGVTAADVKQAKTRLIWAVSSQVAASATIVIFKALADALMHSVDAYRDDDDELTAESVSKTMLTNFAETISGNILWGSEAFSWLKSALTGERYYGVSLNGVDTFTDMLSDGNKLIQKLIKGDLKDAGASAWKLTKAVSQFFGAPLGNAEKFVKMIVNNIEDARNGDLGTFEAGVERTRTQNTRLLFDALQAGDTKKAEKLKAEFKDEKDVRSALKTYIKQIYTEDKQIMKAEVITMLQRYCGMTRRNAENTATEWTMEVVTGTSYSKLGDEYIAGNIPKNTAIRYLQTYGGKTQAEAEQKISEWQCEKDTGIAYSDISNEVKIGNISRDRAIDMLVRYGSKDPDAAEKMVTGYLIEHEYGFAPADLQEEYLAGKVSDAEAFEILAEYKYFGKEDAEDKAADELERLQFVRANPGTEDISITQARNYNASGLQGYISPVDYVQAAKMMGTFHGVDADGDGKTDSYSVVTQKLVYIDSMNLTPEQKTALAKALGISEKTIRKKAPWL